MARLGILPDLNNVIGLNDLLALLTVYGNEWTVDAGDDAEFDIAAYYAGEMDLMQCITTCRSNNAAIMSVEEYALFRDSVDLAMGYDEVNNACSFCSSSYCSASFVRQAYCRNNSILVMASFREGQFQLLMVKHIERRRGRNQPLPDHKRG